jgi:hypothetical protein
MVTQYFESKALFLIHFFGENIFKIITSVPGDRKPLRRTGQIPEAVGASPCDQARFQLLFFGQKNYKLL